MSTNKYKVVRANFSNVISDITSGTIYNVTAAGDLYAVYKVGTYEYLGMYPQKLFIEAVNPFKVGDVVYVKNDIEDLIYHYKYRIIAVDGCVVYIESDVTQVTCLSKVGYHFSNFAIAPTAVRTVNAPTVNSQTTPYVQHNYDCSSINDIVNENISIKKQVGRLVASMQTKPFGEWEPILTKISRKTAYYERNAVELRKRILEVC